MDWVNRYRRLVLAAGVLAALGAGCAQESGHTISAVADVATDWYAERTAEGSDQPETTTPNRFAGLSKTVPDDKPGKTGAESKTGAAGTPGSAPRKAPARLEGFVDPLTKRSDRVAVTLEACLRRALANNLQIQIARFNPAIAHTAVVEAQALFDPSWFLNNALGRIRQDTGTFLAGAATLVAKEWDFETGVETLLPTGATVGLTQDWSYLNSNSAFFMPNPRYTSGLGLTVRQPLLRGAGSQVTTSPIVLARLDHTISVADFKAQVMNALLDVERAYWDLVVEQTRVQALGEALAAARENQRIARRRFEEGKARRLILSLADSAATNREADLVAARLVLTRTSDRLKRLINDPALSLDDPVVLEASERPLTKPIPVGREMLQASMLAAMRSRPEMQQADAALEQAGILERVARNERLPQLDLAAGYRLTGLEPDVDHAVDEQFETRFFDWTVGLELRVPIGNRARTAAHERTRLEQAQALVAREDTRQQILLEVSDAVRNLAAAEESILATRAAREAAQQTLKDQQANVAAGAALVKDLLEAQRDLADATVREMQAMAAYMTSLANVERAKGTLLDYNNIRVAEDDAGDARPAAAGN
ncbi:MAG TPA: TolC family protein [Phycisphaerae bacterium]|nr:TolC family protein [Phycisphaerae bacterium]